MVFSPGGQDLSQPIFEISKIVDFQTFESALFFKLLKNRRERRGAA
jgi:hypothetical protein